MATTRRTPAARGSARTPSGDATGRLVKQQQAENAPALREAATQTTLIRPPLPQESDEIIDATGEAVEGVREISEEEMEAMLADDTEDEYGDDNYVDDSNVDVSALPDGKTDLLLDDQDDFRDLDEPQPKAKTKPFVKRSQEQPAAVGEVTETPQVVAKKFKMMRVVEDIEDVTIGKDNHFTFRYGPRYRVTEHVYNHLDEKGLVLH